LLLAPFPPRRSPDPRAGGRAPSEVPKWPFSDDLPLNRFYVEFDISGIAESIR